MLCVQEPELSLKRIAASSLSDIAKHTPEMAQAVVDAGAVAYLAPLIVSPDAKLKRQVCAALGQVAKHSVDLAEVVVEAEIFPNILMCLKDVDGFVRKHAATCIREVAKHTPARAEMRARPWAMKAAPCSCRARMWRRPESASARYNGSTVPPGMPTTTSVPRRSRKPMISCAPVSLIAGSLRRNRRTFNRHGRQQKTPAGMCAGGGFDERARPLGRVDNDDRYEYEDELLHRIHG